MKISYPLILLTFVLISTSTFAQLKIGSNPTIINSNSLLELETSSKGILFPRLPLQATNNFSPLSAFVQGMVVFNTATNGAGATAVSPGIYYSDGVKWVKVEAGVTTNAYWSLTGNGSTNPSLNFIGTTDNNPLLFKTNNNEALRITPNGDVGIGNSNPLVKLDINGKLKIDSVSLGSSADSILVIGNSDNIVKKIPASTLTTVVKKKFETVATTGQTIFFTPEPFTDANKITLFRNGAIIDFTVAGADKISAEISCVAGDEIKIIQIL